MCSICNRKKKPKRNDNFSVYWHNPLTLQCSHQFQPPHLHLSQPPQTQQINHHQPNHRKMHHNPLHNTLTKFIDTVIHPLSLSWRASGARLVQGSLVPLPSCQPLANGKFRIKLSHWGCKKLCGNGIWERLDVDKLSHEICSFVPEIYSSTPKICSFVLLGTFCSRICTGPAGLVGLAWALAQASIHWPGSSGPALVVNTGHTHRDLPHSLLQP